MILDRLLDLERNPAARSYGDKEYNLDRYRVWLESLGSPQNGQRFVHIAGTKGKGSTAAICEGLLRGLGFPTALYSSPHLTHFGERFRFDGESWSFKEFEERLQAFHDGLAPEQRHGFDGPHSYRTVFEVLTALALVEFRRRGEQLAASGARLPQAVLWETGLGGRLDCTNVVDPVVAVITALGMDHTRILGNTIEKIAAEKAGIIKPGRPVIVSRQPEEHRERVWPVLLRRAEEVGAPVIRAWEHNPVIASEDTAEGLRVRLRLPSGEEGEGLLPLRGQFQAANLEAAVAAAWYMAREEKRSPSPEELLGGLNMVNWPGRLEVHRNRLGNVLILDGAHCPLSARTLGREARRILSAEGRTTFMLLFAMQGDKDARQFLRNLLAHIGDCELMGVLTYPINSPRAATPEQLAEAANAEGLPAIPCASLDAAMNDLATAGCHGVAAGTLYSLSMIRAAWTSA